MRLPPEEVLQYIERSRGISISRDSFASKEYYNANNQEGKNTPVYWANSGKGDGVPVPLVEIQKIIYVVGTTGKAHPSPVPLLNSGRS